IGAVLAAAAVVAAIVIVPKMFGDKTPVTPPGGVANVPGRGAESTEPESTDPNKRYSKRVTTKINAGQFADAVEDLENKAPSSLEPGDKQYLQKQLKQKFLSHIDEQLQNKAFPLAHAELSGALRGIGLTDDDKKQQF